MPRTVIHDCPKQGQKEGAGWKLNVTNDDVSKTKSFEKQIGMMTTEEVGLYLCSSFIPLSGCVGMFASVANSISSALP
jgi:hypothetical protein